MQDKGLLHQKGQLDASVLKDIEGCLKVNELLSLMLHRHIISKIDETTFFMLRCYQKLHHHIPALL